MRHWAKAPEQRMQMVLYCKNLDEAIPKNHVVRFLDEILRKLDWSAWEAKYHPQMGQPPIHPRVTCSVLLYGLLARIRSTRGLEEAIQIRLDFRWLVEGRTIDHSTLSVFRNSHQQQLKDLFIQICQLARSLGVLSLERLGFDGTRVRANNRRTGTRTPEQLRNERDELTKKFEEFNRQVEQEDARDEEAFGLTSPQELPNELQNSEIRRARLEAALNDLQRAEEDGRKVPNRVPTTDLDSRVMPNKEGGYAPNYTPTATVDIDSGLIVAASVLTVVNEDVDLMPQIEDVQQQFNLPSPPAVLVDGLNGTGANLAACADRGITIYSPSDLPQQDDNPALRDDLTQPVPESAWDRLPKRKATVNNQTQLQLDKSAFIYDKQTNCYWCPLGKVLKYTNTTSEKSGSGRRIRARYAADPSMCAQCPLREHCLLGTCKARQINREQYEEHRERHAQHMSQPESKEIYSLRCHAGERPFAMIKQRFGVRQFLTRGLTRVQNEWQWAAAAFNLHRLASLLWSRAGPSTA